jgi:hypothetical protein
MVESRRQSLLPQEQIEGENFAHPLDDADGLLRETAAILRAVAKDRILELVRVFAVERSAAVQELVGGDAETPPVDAPGVASARDHLGRHVRHRATPGCVHPARGVVHCDVEVGQGGVAISVEEDVVGLDVPMDDPLAVQVLDGRRELGDPVAHDALGKGLGLAVEVEAKVAAHHQVQYVEAVLSVLESVAHVADERMVDLFEQTTFLDDVSHRLKLNARNELNTLG